MFKESISLAPYAMHADATRGRLYPGTQSVVGDQFYEDILRVIRSTAFRRLAHKTQVFINTPDKIDHHRSRLTHSIETAAVGRLIAENLRLSTNLTEAICLAHDIGHPPFGHAGEDVLDELLKEYGGFNHNYYAFKLITMLEERYLGYNGLNLTWETLEGIIKHNGPFLDHKYPKFIAEYNKLHDLELDRFPSLEAQVASISDDIAYVSHDLEDALREGIFTLSELLSQQFMVDMGIRFDFDYKGYEKRVGTEIMAAISNFFIQDVLDASKRNIAQAQIKRFADVQNSSAVLITLSPAGRKVLFAAKAFLLKNFYTNPKITSVRDAYKQMIRDVFNRYMQNPSLLPDVWRAKDGDLPVLVGDYIAGMTDKFIIRMAEV